MFVVSTCVLTESKHEAGLVDQLLRSPRNLVPRHLLAAAAVLLMMAAIRHHDTASAHRWLDLCHSELVRSSWSAQNSHKQTRRPVSTSDSISPAMEQNPCLHSHLHRNAKHVSAAIKASQQLGWALPE